MCGTAQQTEWGSIVRLRGGAIVTGAPQGSAEQEEIAERLGYGADMLAMVQDHDPLHVLLCDWLGLPDSQSLRCAAGLDFDAAVADEGCGVSRDAAKR